MAARGTPPANVAARISETAESAGSASRSIDRGQDRVADAVLILGQRSRKGLSRLGITAELDLGGDDKRLGPQNLGALQCALVISAAAKSVLPRPREPLRTQLRIAHGACDVAVDRRLPPYARIVADDN